jgi:hypothetical protein
MATPDRLALGISPLRALSALHLGGPQLANFRLQLLAAEILCGVKLRSEERGRFDISESLSTFKSETVFMPYLQLKAD